jgi:GT2 family glycosyltransferase
MPSLSVIIVNYNVKYFVEQCLCSVRKASAGLQVQVLVVDNASTDGSKSYLEPRFPSVRFFWNQENLGFAKANNRALREATGDYILFLNPDTIIPEDSFRQCLEYLEKNPGTGALGVRMLDAGGRFLRESRRGFPDPFTALYKLTGMANLFSTSRIFARYHMGHLDPFQVHETDVLAGAFMMVRATVLEKTGGFDEDYFMYGEDIDLSFRIRKAGWKNFYYPHCPILHFKGESTRKGSLNYVKMFYGAMAIFARKHYGDWRAGAFSSSIQLAILLRAILSALGGGARKVLRVCGNLLRSGPKTDPGFLVVANSSRFDEIESLWDSKLFPGRPITRYDPPRAGQQMGDWFSGFVQSVENHGYTDLIFCENGLAFRDIIALLSLLPKNIRLRINAAGSGSMVGDGQSIVLPPNPSSPQIPDQLPD